MENDQPEENPIFQQGVPPHYAFPVRQFLDETFPGGLGGGMLSNGQQDHLIDLPFLLVRTSEI